MEEQNLAKDLHLMFSTTLFLKNAKPVFLVIIYYLTVRLQIIAMYKQKQLAEFECSKGNILRSIATYYTSGVMGKRKYQAV